MQTRQPEDDNKVCGIDITQGNLLKHAAQTDLQSPSLGPHEGEGTQSSGLSQIAKDIQLRIGWQQPLNICHW